MSLKEIEQPQWVDNYCVSRETLSDCVERWKYTFLKEYGDIYICKPFPGIHLWANDVFMYAIPTEQSEEYHFVKLNYCIDGRCEVLLADDRYVYLEKGILSVDSNSPKDNFLFPGARYQGIELVLDLERLGRENVQALSDLGIDAGKLVEELSKYQGSYIATVSRQFKEIMEELWDLLLHHKGEIEDFRFYTLQILYLLKKGNTTSIEKKFYLTKGQRAIAAKVEKRISADLKDHYTVEELAGECGISPSSLKKYFEQVYGMPVSEYLRQKRMELAKELLAHSRMSVADIAAEAGYGNQGKFSSAFKRYTQKTPLEYRRLQNMCDEGGKEKKDE